MSTRSIIPAPIFVAVALTVGYTTVDQAMAVELASAHELTLTATNFAFSAPDTAPAGWSSIRFVNNSDLIHMAHLVRLESGRTVEDLTESYLAAVDDAALDPTLEAYLEVELTAGDYVLVCFLSSAPDGRSHIEHGMILPLRVR